jgi:ribosomal protein S18 acetylase RimI-like enzyme
LSFRIVPIAEQHVEAAKANGLTRVELTVRVDNERARTLFEEQ